MNPETLTQWRGNLGLSEVAFAAYIGAPVNTVRNWLHGRRKPDAATLRLFALLRRIDLDAPGLHADLIREAQNGPPAAPLGRRRAAPGPASPQVAPGEKNASEPVPDWLKIAV